MIERRSRLRIIRTVFAIRFIKFSLFYMTVLLAFKLFSSWSTVADLKECFAVSSPLRSGYIISQSSFTAAIIILMAVLFVLLHRLLGPLPRIEKVLLKVIGGDYSVRIYVRRKDAISSLTEKLNKVLDLLEEKKKS